MGQTPSWSEVIEASFDDYIGRFFTAVPGVVVEYHATTQTVDITAGVTIPYETATGEVGYDAIPMLHNVPVVFPGAGAHSITFPIKQGDTMLLVVCNCDISGWKRSPSGAAVDPKSAHRNHISDAVAIPGLRILKKSIKPAPPSDGMVITSPVLRLGSAAASQAVVVQSALDAFVAALQASIAALDVPTPNPAQAAALLALQTLYSQLGTEWLAGTTKVKAE